MPRTVIWKKTGTADPWTRQVGTPPFNLGATDPGQYDVDVGDGIIRNLTVPSAFNVETVDGDPVVNYGSGGAVSITVTGGDYAGTYTTNSDGQALTTTMLEAGPVNLKKPVISGSTGPGDTLTAVPGFWVFSGEPMADPTFQWKRSGVVIPDEVLLAYTLVSADQGDNVTMSETLGTVTVTSNALAIPDATMATDLGATAWYDATSVVVNGSNIVTAWNSKVAGKSQWNLDTVPGGLTGPTWSANGAVFAGAHGLRGSVATGAIWDPVQDFDVTRLFFCVVEMDATAPVCIVIGASADQNYNQSWGFGYDGETVLKVHAHNQKFGSSFSNTPVTTNPPVAPGKVLLEYELNKTELVIRANGVVVATKPVTTLTAMADSTLMKPNLGFEASNGTTTSTSKRMTGKIYEIFVTETIANRAAYRAELAAKHGITL